MLTKQIRILIAACIQCYVILLAQWAVGSPSLLVSKSHGGVVLRDVVGGHDGSESMVGFDDLSGHFQPSQFYDSVIKFNQLLPANTVCCRNSRVKGEDE